MTRPGRRSLITLTGRKKKIRLTQALTQTQIQSPQTRSISIFICSWLLIVFAAVSLSRHRVQRSSSSCRTGVRYEGHVSPVAGTYTKPDRANKCLQLKKLKRMERRRKEKSNKRSNLKGRGGREVLVRQKHHGEICKTCIQTRCFAVKCIVRVVKAGPQKNDALVKKNAGTPNNPSQQRVSRLALQRTLACQVVFLRRIWLRDKRKMPFDVFRCGTSAHGAKFVVMLCAFVSPGQNPSFSEGGRR